jgi:acetyl esterase/lipase
VTEVLYREGKQVTHAMHQRCRLDVYFPATKRPFQTVVWFHGGGLTGGERTIPIPLRNQGIAVVAVNYRLGPEVQSPAYIEDAAAAVAWTFKHIAEFGGDPAQIFVSGHSAGAYLASMIGLDKQWLSVLGCDADKIAGLVPLSGQMITHFAIREERGLAETQPVVDSMAPLFHVRKSAPPLLLVTGDREKELMGRYEENAYFWRAMKLAGHADVTLHELQGFDHGRMPEPAFPLLLKFVKGRPDPLRR